MPTGDLRGVTVLVVEDEFLIAMEIESVLTDAGAKVLGPCANVKDALVAINATQPSIASLDIRLGYETSEPIAAILTEKEIPFFFYSGQDLPKAMMERWSDKVLIPKPATAEKLLSCIASMTKR